MIVAKYEYYTLAGGGRSEIIYWDGAIFSLNYGYYDAVYLATSPSEAGEISIFLHR
jgi:hypothetical protein